LIPINMDWLLGRTPPSPEQLARKQAECDTRYFDYKVCSRTYGFNDRNCHLRYLANYEACITELQKLQSALD
jgi:hypothetical protein